MKAPRRFLLLAFLVCLMSLILLTNTPATLGSIVVERPPLEREVSLLGDHQIDRAHPGRRPATNGQPFPPYCPQLYPEFQGPASIPIPDGGVITATITVTDAEPYMWDLYLDMFVSHTYSSDLDVTITSPEGTIVTLTTDNGGDYDDVFAEVTFWDFLSFYGDIPYYINVIIASEYQYLEDGPIPQFALVPEEALQAFSGQNPNGTWTLTVQDDTVNGETGTFNGWGFSFVEFPEWVITDVVTLTYAGPPLPIPDDGSLVTSSIFITQTPYDAVIDADLTLDITHPSSGDLQTQIRSGLGRYNTISTDNGGPYPDVFSHSVWDDDADPLGALPYTYSNGIVSDYNFTGKGPVGPLVVEESMGSFMGGDPTGVWEVRALDNRQNGITGTLNSWELRLVVGQCPEPTPTPTSTATPTVTVVPPTSTSTPAIPSSTPTATVATSTPTITGSTATPTVTEPTPTSSPPVSTTPVPPEGSRLFLPVIQR